MLFIFVKDKTELEEFCLLHGQKLTYGDSSDSSFETLIESSTCGLLAANLEVFDLFEIFCNLSDCLIG